MICNLTKAKGVKCHVILINGFICSVRGPGRHRLEDEPDTGYINIVHLSSFFTVGSAGAALWYLVATESFTVQITPAGILCLQVEYG